MDQHEVGLVDGWHATALLIDQRCFVCKAWQKTLRSIHDQSITYSTHAILKLSMATWLYHGYHIIGWFYVQKGSCWSRMFFPAKQVALFEVDETLGTNIYLVKFVLTASL